MLATISLSSRFGLPPERLATVRVVSTPEAKAAVGNVILSLAPHPLGTQGEFVGVDSGGGRLSFKQTYDLGQDVYEPGYGKADLLPLDYRVFDLHGGIVPLGTRPDGVTGAPGTFDANLPIGAGKIIALGNTPAVPEPAAWATMAAGFAVVGAGLRRRRPATRAA